MLRLIKHLLMPGWWVRRVFRHEDRAAIEEAVTASEKTHRGEICFVVEGPLPFLRILRGSSSRERAQELFARFGVGKTVEASGILIYIQLVDRRVEILADTGIARRVDEAEWQRMCRQMEAAFAQGAWRRGALEAIDRATTLLTMYFPARGNNPNELDDRLRFL